MKAVLLIIASAFMVAMFVRIVEMSLWFDWVDLLWTFLFFLGAVFTAVPYSQTEWTD